MTERAYQVKFCLSTWLIELYSESGFLGAEEVIGSGGPPQLRIVDYRMRIEKENPKVRNPQFNRPMRSAGHTLASGPQDGLSPGKGIAKVNGGRSPSLVDTQDEGWLNELSFQGEGPGRTLKESAIDGVRTKKF